MEKRLITAVSAAHRDACEAFVLSMGFSWPRKGNKLENNVYPWEDGWRWLVVRDDWTVIVQGLEHDLSGIEEFDFKNPWAPERVIMVADFPVIVDAKGIGVGCQLIGVEDVNELVRRIRRMYWWKE